MKLHWSTGSALLALSASPALAADPDSPSSVFTPASNSSLLWGPYRPNLYFGIRPRLPKSLTTALLWSRVEDFSSVQNNVRYTCEQHEGMAGYGWDAYDPRTGGVQTVHDKGNGLDMETSFVKFEDGGWGARVKGTPREDAGPIVRPGDGLKTSVWFTMGAEGLGSLELRDAERGRGLGFLDDLVFEGETADLGEFRVEMVEREGSKHPKHDHASYEEKPLDRSFVHSLQMPEEALWQSKALIFGAMKSTIDDYVKTYGQEKMPPPWQTFTMENKPGQGNVHMVQKVFEGPFEFDIFYTPSKEGKTPTSEELTSRIEATVTSFDTKYKEALAPKAPFKGKQYERFTKSLFSNLIGGIGYFHGTQVVDRSYAPEYEEENEGFWMEAAIARARNLQKPEGPYELFTSVPSRPFFPRGFLWDEGFHLIPIVDFDPELVMQILTSWFNTMDEDGWIPREQILGEEAMSKVPPEFQIQFPHYANPPTLFMVLEALLDKAESSKAFGTATGQQGLGLSALADPTLLKDWMTKMYPLLQRNFQWYRKTQSGDLKSYDHGDTFSSKEAYRWRGRTPTHILTSGLDDYPRAQPPHPGELHVDLMSWMGMMTRAMERIATFVAEPDDAASYAKISTAIRRNTDDLHWSARDAAYCDVTVDAYEESVHVCHKGYVSLFPFMTGLLDPHHAHLGAVLDLLADEEELWSRHGIRSLSKRDALYGTEENYWRSPVWMPINYLILSNLYATARQAGPQRARAEKLYNSLRESLVETVFESWKETGFAWEQYSPDTGAGQRTQHFTGWTSLVAKMAAMPEVKGAAGHDEL